MNWLMTFEFSNSYFIILYIIVAFLSWVLFFKWMIRDWTNMFNSDYGVDRGVLIGSFFSSAYFGAVFFMTVPGILIYFFMKKINIVFVPFAKVLLALAYLGDKTPKIK